MVNGMKKSFYKKPARDERERLLLLGLVELYLQTGKPVGSNTLRENGFESLSSATIRNYFSKLENSGYLRQQHSSGGRIPTQLAYKAYADACSAPAGEYAHADKEAKGLIRKKLVSEQREVASYLQKAAENISELSRCAIFLSAPRFDQDFLLDAKFLGIDNHRILCALTTDFGLVHTEILHTEKKLSSFSLKRIEGYFHARLTKQARPDLTPEEEKVAEKFYHEIMMRRIASYANFSAEDVYKTGFSQLLNYPDFSNASVLAAGLSLFENTERLRALLQECCKKRAMSCWIGEDLANFASAAGSCSVIAIPYSIGQNIVGAIALLGPNRIPYRQLFQLMHLAGEAISETLTKSLYKFKITYREPSTTLFGAQKGQPVLIGETQCYLLEDKRHLSQGE